MGLSTSRSPCLCARVPFWRVCHFDFLANYPNHHGISDAFPTPMRRSAEFPWALGSSKLHTARKQFMFDTEIRKIWHSSGSVTVASFYIESVLSELWDRNWRTSFAKNGNWSDRNFPGCAWAWSRPCGPNKVHMLRHSPMTFSII